jgi:hypothetical protein
MQRSPLAAVALAVLLLTAGCSGVIGGDSQTPTDGSTPVDDGAANTIPGVEDGQLTNATALFAAHDRGVVETGFENEVRINATVVQSGQAVDIQRRQRTIVAAGRGEFQYQTVNGQGGGFVKFDHCGNESVWVIRGTLGDEVRYQVRDEVPPTRTLTGTALLGNYVNGTNATAVDVREEGELTLVTFETTRLPAETNALPANASDVRDYRAQFVVDTEGRIHGLVAEGTYDLQGETRTFSVTYNLKRLDDPSVQRPDWAGEALANASA